MDRVQIKENAKALLKENRLTCALVAFLVTLLAGGGAGGFSTSYNFSYNASSAPADSTVSPDIESFFNNIDSEEAIFTILIGIVVFTLALCFGILFSAFVGNQIKVGSCRFYLKNRKNHPVDVGEIFQSYRDKTFLNVAKVTIMRDLSIFLWSLLCFIPGIIKTYEYAAVNYLLCLNPTMDYKMATELSKKIMNGHKMELFELYISFIGWEFLSLFTCGILGIVHVNPYILIAEAEFFSFVRENAIMNGVISSFDIPDYEEYTFTQHGFTGFTPNVNSTFGDGFTAPVENKENEAPLSYNENAPIEVPFEETTEESPVEDTVIEDSSPIEEPAVPEEPEIPDENE